MRHVKLYSDSVYDHPDYARPVSSAPKTTWKCKDCGGYHTTEASRKYYCAIISRF